MSTNPNFVTPLLFPQQIEIPLKLRFIVETQEDLDDLMESVNNLNTASVGLKADLFDMLVNECGYQLIDIDGTTHSEVRKALAQSI